MRFAVAAVFGLSQLVDAKRVSIVPTDRQRGELAISSRQSSIHIQDSYTQFPAYTLQVPVDHFHNETKYEPHSNATFGLRYWFDASHLKDDGPVFLLSGGETSGADRLPFLEKGLIHQLAELTGGVAVVIEHRYYGQSIPTEDFSAQSLRFLDTQQAMADTAYFAQNVVFPGLEDHDFTAASRPYILYGGSYAGAFVAFLRVTYPDIFWGSIASSAVTEAIYDYWQYYEAIAQYAEAGCISLTEKIINIIDNIVLHHADPLLKQKLKSTWQLGNVTNIQDFANVVSSPPGYWQNRNWDPKVGDPTWEDYCSALTNKSVEYPSTSALFSDVQELIIAGNHSAELSELTIPVLNHIGWINDTQVSACSNSLTQDECFTVNNATFMQQDDLDQTWRLWPYQVCTQWGYFMTGGPPADIKPIVSRIMDIRYEQQLCEIAFNITNDPDVKSINQYGGFDLACDRIAFVDGEADPWRPATPHAKSAKLRKSTITRPFILIEGAVHHWDENGLFDNETTKDLPPRPVKKAQDQEHDFIIAWWEEWKEKKARNTGAGGQRQDELNFGDDSTSHQQIVAL